MEQIKEVVFTACTALIIGELIYYLSPKDKLTDCIYALLYTVIIITAVLNFTKVNFNFDNYIKDSVYQEEIDEQLSNYYEDLTEREMKKIIFDALDVVHIKCNDIVVQVSSDGENISIHKIKVILEYSQDVNNTKIILNQLFGDNSLLEVSHG